MQNDDRLVGRILSRRDALKLLGLAGAGLIAGCVPGVSSIVQATQTLSPTVISPTPLPVLSAVQTPLPLPACLVRPALTEGPFFVDEDLNRSDIRSDPANGDVKDGAPLNLTFNVSRIGAGSCEPLPDARVDIWHCDASGAYSDVSDRGSTTRGQKFLRGNQQTDATGHASFTTIYPGWYPGRTVHIHFKIRHSSAGNNYEFTSQLFFDDALSDRVFADSPYAGRGQRDTLNNRDGIYRDELLLKVSASYGAYLASFDIGLHV